MTYRTLGELRSELLARLGMGGQGASGGAAATLSDSFLRNGQHQLYWAQDWKHLTAYEDVPLGVGQTLLDYATAATRDRRILRIETYFGGQWRLLTEGIRTEDWNTMTTQSYPLRYDRYAQIQFYPEPDAIYTVRQWYVRDLGRFTQTGDEASLDDEMVLLHAIANGKAHYRHPDAQVYQGQLSTLLASLRGQSFTNQAVYRRDETPPAMVRPVVV